MESQLFAQTGEGNVKDETIQNRRADRAEDAEQKLVRSPLVVTSGFSWKHTE